MSINHLINKEQIAKRFAQAQQSYDGHAWVQQKICQNLSVLMDQYLEKQALSAVLDIGCGSGQLSHLIAEKIQVDEWFLNDLYPEIKVHYSDFKQVNFLIGDIEKLSLDMPLDLVVSSSALQWVKEIDGVFSKVSRQLKLNHLLCFSTFGRQNLTEIRQLTGHGLDYLSELELKLSLEKNGFEILHFSESLEMMPFEHPKQILQHLKATGVTATAKKFRWNKSTLHAFYEAYEALIFQLGDGQKIYPLTYHPIYCIARRIK